MSLHSQMRKGPFVLLIAALVLVIVAFAFWGDHSASTRTIGLSDRSRSVSSTNAQLLSALRDAESGQRGYLLTGLPNYLRPFGKCQQDVLEALMRLDDLTGDSPVQNAAIDQLSLLVSEKLDEMRLTIEVYDARGLAPAVVLVETDRGRLLMEQIRSLSLAIEDRESKRLSALQSTLHSRLARTRATVGAGGMILFLLVLLAHIVIKREMRQQHRLTVTLHARQTDLREKLVEIERQREVLRTSEEHLKLAFETTGMSSWCWVPDQNTIRWTEGNEHTLDVPGLVKYSSWAKMLAQVHSDHRAAVRKAISGAIRTRSEFEVEFHTRGEQAQRRWISAKGRYIPASDKHPENFVGVLRDITDQRRAQEVLRETELQLHQSQKMEAVGRLAGGVAHDFNNILTVISGFTELICLDSSIQGKSRAFLSEVQKATGRATRLTNQLLCFSRKEIIKPSELDLNEVVTGLFDMLRRLVGDNIVIHKIVSPLPVPVRADRGQIEQVIMNLVVNGRDAMPNGGSLTLSTYTVFQDQLPDSKQRMDAGNYCVLTVTDTGTGMTPEIQEKMFEPFFTTKERGHGTGLGLSTVFGILEQNRGKAIVHSEIGKGSRFEIYFPLVKETTRGPVGVEPARREGVVGTETILVVEDEPAVRGFVVQILRKYGYQVLEAANGLQGLEKGRLHSRRIDLVLTDVTMPVMGGPQMVAALTELRSDLAVIYMSGYSDSELSKGRIVPPLKLLEKPFTAPALLNTVRDVLDARSVIPSVPSATAVFS